MRTERRTVEEVIFDEICHDIYVESRSKRFYKKDKKGFYYVPEVLAMSGGNNNAIR
jgi:hypothetical protein